MRVRWPSAPIALESSGASSGEDPNRSIVTEMSETPLAGLRMAPTVAGEGERSANAERRLVHPGGREGENLTPGFGDADHVLELRRQRAVAGDGGPAVVEHFHLGTAGVHHGFDGEEHARLQHRTVTGPAEMQDIGRLVETA